MTTMLERPTEAPEIKPSLLSIADPSGDTRIQWTPGNADEEAVARTAFNSAKEKGMLAYALSDSGERTGEVIREFDPEAGKIVMTRQLQGG